VLDVSPSIFRELAEMRGAAHSLRRKSIAADEIAVGLLFRRGASAAAVFNGPARWLDRAIQSKNFAGVENSSESNIYESIFLAARELFRGRTAEKRSSC